MLIGVPTLMGIFFYFLPLKIDFFLQLESEGIAFRLEDTMNNNENKTTAITSHQNLTSAPLSNNKFQGDFDYFKAQEVAELMLFSGLISLDEFKKLTARYRKTFSPMNVEIMAEIT